jgi:hypothetical protein
MNDPIEMLDNIIFMAQRTKDALEKNQTLKREYMEKLGEYLDNAYREMSYAAIHE